MKSIENRNTSLSTNLLDFYSTLEAHDWTYVYSSDHRAYSRGQSESNRLRNIAKSCPRALELYVAYSEHIYNGQPKPVIPRKPNDRQKERLLFLEHFNRVLEQHYTDPTVSISFLAKSIAVSERQFYRKVRAYLGSTPTEYIKYFRLQKAKAILDSGKSATYATYESGFSCQSYFGRCFKKQYGLSPRDYRKSRYLLKYS